MSASPKGQDASDFRLNTYRVLLTRARYQTILWVREGDARDKTSEPALLDDTADFLISSGASLLQTIAEPAMKLAELLLL